MVGCLYTIFFLGTITFSLSTPDPHAKPLDKININLILNENEKGREDYSGHAQQDSLTQDADNLLGKNIDDNKYEDAFENGNEAGYLKQFYSQRGPRYRYHYQGKFGRYGAGYSGKRDHTRYSAQNPGWHKCAMSIPSRLYATKTWYDAVANMDTSPLQFPGCSPILYWSLIRHGTRYPGAPSGEIDINAMLGLENGLRNKILATPKSKLCQHQKEDLRKWNVLNGLSINDTKKLTKSGRLEQMRLGTRIQSRMPVFFSVYDKENFLLRHSTTERAESSAKEFANGMFPGENVIVEEVKGNPITNYDDNCPRWLKEVKDNSSTYKHQKDFLRGVEIKNLIVNLTDHLGVRITWNDITLMYDTCRFEMAWSPQSTSPWCSIFTSDQVKLLNFAEDLKFYYRNGYGTELYQEVSCPAINDFLTRADDKINSFSKSSSSSKILSTSSSIPSPKAVFFFSHSNALQLLLSSLGLFQDSNPLTSVSFNIHGNHRLWNTSYIVPFSGNLAFLLLKCDNGNNRVVTLHNERKVVIKNCGEDCSWHNFKRILGRFSKCDHQNICGLSGGES